ncbi:MULTISPECIES: endo-1,4-beta-xylanase [Arenibacter]|uniref:endo-1,4-beta-xylanase n=1 Tax=Arenibacter TaxID=178469 RepID=UPI00068F7FAF|nr:MULTISPECIES: endo-1,4-beta-xylanase [Arenibacter]GBF20455.1 endo-1,4-beta-xylanase A precursor [Arenibacter sp. NBRC 103722]
MFSTKAHFFSNLQVLKKKIMPLVVFLILVGCSELDKKQIIEKKISLKSAFQHQFLIGAAINENQILGRDSLAQKLIRGEFNSISPENCMKWKFLHPKKNTFFFETSDKFVAYGIDNDMFIIGHTLVWHSQLAPWAAMVDNKEELSNNLKNHITTIVGRYKSRINGWDVVNEALNEDGTLRESVFLKVLGDGYLSDSFKWAKEADPSAELYYNDYNLCNKEKRDGVIKLVKNLQENGAEIDGIGMQGHWNLEGPSLEDIEASILAYYNLGLKVMITELDITVLPNPNDLEGAEVNQHFENSAFMNPYPAKLPDSISIKLAKRYQDIFKLFKKHSEKISRVTFWGVNDNQSWLNNWPVKGRKNYPLLFDRDYQPKVAYDSVINIIVNSQKNPIN